MKMSPSGFVAFAVGTILLCGCELDDSEENTETVVTEVLPDDTVKTTKRTPKTNAEGDQTVEETTTTHSSGAVFTSGDLGGCVITSEDFYTSEE